MRFFPLITELIFYIQKKNVLNFGSEINSINETFTRLWFNNKTIINLRYLENYLNQ